MVSVGFCCFCFEYVVSSSVYLGFYIVSVVCEFGVGVLDRMFICWFGCWNFVENIWIISDNCVGCYDYERIIFLEVDIVWGYLLCYDSMGLL